MWQTETANTAQVTVANVDALGRPGALTQAFYDATTGYNTYRYTVKREYNLAGAVTKQTYPSGHFVSYNYDNAGRLADVPAPTPLPAFSGNLGDGATRSYAKELQYGIFGLEQETYGMVTPLYHRMSYNVRGQMWDMQLGTGELVTGAESYNRGRI